MTKTIEDKIKILENGGCIITLDDEESGLYRSVCVYDGRLSYGTLDELILLYGLEEEE